MPSNDLSVLIHLLGFAMGAALYAMLGAMALRERRGKGGAQFFGGHAVDRVAVATAGLGLLWNAGGLLAYGLRDLGFGTPPALLVALPFAALGFLPAVVVDAASQNLVRRSEARSLVVLAYALSGVAAWINFFSGATAGIAPSRIALQLLSVGYVCLTIGLAFISRHQAGWRKTLSAVALAAFAVMAMHLSEHGPSSEALWVELLGHHASIPLVLAILYQDYRFALADLFLKRVLSMVGLLVVSVLTYVLIVAPFIAPRLVTDPLDPRGAVGLIGLSLVTAVMYPALRSACSRFVDRVVLARADYHQLRAQIASRVLLAEDEDAVLGGTCELLAPALSARQITYSPILAGTHNMLHVVSMEGRQEARAVVSTTDVPLYVLTVSGLAGGRVLLSDDLGMLESAATIAAIRIDAIRLTRERIDRTVRENQIMQLAAEAELRALRAQLNPHFLFNALTTIGHLMGEAPARALETLYRLTELLRAVLRRSEGTFVSLGQEMDIIEAYLAIEYARFEERLRVHIDIPPDLMNASVPPLILQPLVENAVKHGISGRVGGGSITVSGRRTSHGGEDRETLILTVSDTGVGVANNNLEHFGANGFGLSSVAQRLERHFGTRASIDFQSDPGAGTTVVLRLPLVPRVDTPIAIAQQVVS